MMRLCVRTSVAAASLQFLCTSVLLASTGTKLLADTPKQAVPVDVPAPTAVITGHLVNGGASGSVSIAKPIDVKVPGLVAVRSEACAAGPVPNPTPFPFDIRGGALLSPKGKLDLGVDCTLPDLHLLPTLTTRLDADAIFGANIGGSQTIFPITFDQLYSKALPGTTSIYFGGGAGMYLGGRSRFGGKVVLGATFNRFGVEANLHFSGSGEPLLSLQGRLAL